MEINLPTRPVDMVMVIATGEGEQERRQGLHVEYYARHEVGIPQALFIYSGELTDRMNIPIATVVIYSERRPPERRPPGQYVVRVGDRVVNRFEYPDIWLMDYEAEIRSGELAPLAPFLLEIVARPTVETVQEATHHPRRRSEDGASHKPEPLAAFAGPPGDTCACTQVHVSIARLQNGAP